MGKNGCRENNDRVRSTRGCAILPIGCAALLSFPLSSSISIQKALRNNKGKGHRTRIQTPEAGKAACKVTAPEAEATGTSSTGCRRLPGQNLGSFALLCCLQTLIYLPVSEQMDTRL